MKRSVAITLLTVALLAGTAPGAGAATLKEYYKVSGGTIQVSLVMDKFAKNVFTFLPLAKMNEILHFKTDKSFEDSLLDVTGTWQYNARKSLLGVDITAYAEEMGADLETMLDEAGADQTPPLDFTVTTLSSPFTGKLDRRGTLAGAMTLRYKVVVSPVPTALWLFWPSGVSNLTIAMKYKARPFTPPALAEGGAAGPDLLGIVQELHRPVLR